MVLVCHMISEDYVINGSYDFMGRISLRFISYSAKFGGYRHWASCPVISQDTRSKGHVTLWLGTPECNS